MKLTIRDLLWLILVCAIALAWLQSDRRRVAELHEQAASRNTTIEDWKSSIAESLLRFKTAAIDPIRDENPVVQDLPIPDRKNRYLQAHYEMMAHLRHMGAVPPPNATAAQIQAATSPANPPTAP
jgi:hypothetical protein